MGCNRLPRATTCVFLAVIAGAVPCFAQDDRPAPPQPILNNDQLLRKYVIATFGNEGAIGAAIAGGVEQWRGSPPEWGTGPEGYAKRWASMFGAQTIAGTTKYAVARIFHHDPSFTRCQCTGFARRLRHSATSAFMARRRDGSRVLSPATVASIVAGEVVPAATWYPTRGGAWGGLGHAGAGVAGKIGVNVLREFLPPRFLGSRPF
jgi:hypothetical protein